MTKDLKIDSIGVSTNDGTVCADTVPNEYLNLILILVYIHIKISHYNVFDSFSRDRNGLLLSPYF